MQNSELFKRGIGLAKRISARLDEIRAFDFPTESPELLADIIQHLVSSVASVLEQTDDERLEKFACQSLELISSHLRYIEGARSSRIPTSLVQPIEAIMAHFKPDSRVMIRVQHTYNYTVFDILQMYRRMFAHLIPSIDDLIGKTSAFFVISVPSVESSNILLHCLLAHELGHQIADKYLASEDQEGLVRSIEELIGEDLTWWDADIEKLPPLFKLPLRQRVFDAVLQARKRALQELISDSVAYHLVGLNAILAIEEMSSSDILDSLPEEGNRWYPPWRYRIRQMMTLIKEDNIDEMIGQINGSQSIEMIRDSVQSKFKGLEAIANEDSDNVQIAANGILSRAYKDVPTVMAGIRAFITTALPGLQYPSTSFNKQIAPLLERLILGIPPDDIDGVLPDWRMAMTAGWFYRIGRRPIPHSRGREWSFEDDEIVCRLVLKAVESIHLARQYRKHIKPA